MNLTTSYWATADDSIFEAGHYVESWELDHIAQLSDGVANLLCEEALRGNKIRIILKGYIEFEKPIAQKVWNLPEGLVFWCPLQEKHIGHYDGDEDGVIVCLKTDTRVSPLGYEAQRDNGI